MNSRYYVDVNCSVGKRANLINENIPYTVSQLIDDQKKYGIDISMVTMEYARYYSAFVANKEILKLCEGKDRLLPVASLYPGFENDVEDVKKYLLNILSSGFKGISLNLNNFFIYNYDFLKFTFDFADRVHLPIIVEWDELENISKDFFEDIKRYRNLKIIVKHVNFAYLKYLVAYMKDNKNIFIGLDGCIKQDLLENLCKDIGDDRILFSSGYPIGNIGVSKAVVEYADISEESKDKIAYKNALKLFNVDLVLGKNCADYMDPISSAVDSGESLKNIIKTPIFDTHTHINDEEAGSIGWYGNGVTLDSLINSSNKVGVSKVVMSATEGVAYNGEIGNEVVDKAIRKYREFVLGYACANPYYESDIEDCLKHLKRNDFIGLKLYPATNHYPYHGKLYKKVLEMTADLNKAFLLHGSPSDAKKILEMYKGLNVILAHTTQSYDFMEEVLPLLEQYKNLYVDICSRYIVNGSVEYLVKNGFEDRILFGSDASLLSQSAHIGLVGYSDISLDAKEKILSKNALKVIKKR